LSVEVKGARVSVERRGASGCGGGSPAAAPRPRTAAAAAPAGACPGVPISSIFRAQNRRGIGKSQPKWNRVHDGHARLTARRGGATTGGCTPAASCGRRHPRRRATMRGRWVTAAAQTAARGAAAAQQGPPLPADAPCTPCFRNPAHTAVMPREKRLTFFSAAPPPPPPGWPHRSQLWELGSGTTERSRRPTSTRRRKWSVHASWLRFLYSSRRSSATCGRRLERVHPRALSDGRTRRGTQGQPRVEAGPAQGLPRRGSTGGWWFVCSVLRG
jgi:hypothetical protein